MVPLSRPLNATSFSASDIFLNSGHRDEKVLLGIKHDYLSSALTKSYETTHFPFGCRLFRRSGYPESSESRRD